MNIQDTIVHYSIDAEGNVKMLGKFRVGDLRENSDIMSELGIERCG